MLNHPKKSIVYIQRLNKLNNQQYNLKTIYLRERDVGNYVNQIHSIRANNLILELVIGSDQILKFTELVMGTSFFIVQNMFI